MSQLYESLSLNLERELNDSLRETARSLNVHIDLPLDHSIDIHIGDDIADALPWFSLPLEPGGFVEVRDNTVRVVSEAGNDDAQAIVRRVFRLGDRGWRGIGTIPQSGYRLRDAYRLYDAELRFPEIKTINPQESSLCISGLVLQGLKKPNECPAFGKECTPQSPLGATMVSSEGACAAYYQYGRYSSSLQEQEKSQ